MPLVIGGIGGLLAGIVVIAGADRPTIVHRSAPASPTAAAPSSAASVPGSVAARTAVTSVASVTPTAPIASDRKAKAAPDREIAEARPGSRVAALRRVPALDRQHDCIDDPRCGRQAVLAADRALRDAYADAVEAGVARSELTAIRNRWARLRDTQYDQPDLLLSRYQSMTGQLQRAAREADGDPY